MNKPFIKRPIISYAAWLLIIGAMSSCGGSDSNVTSTIISSSQDIQPTPVVDDDNTPPEITLLGEKVVILAINDSYFDPGAFANDAEDGDISSSISVSGAINESIPGDYVIRYSVADSGGKSYNTIRLIRVYDANPTQSTLRYINNTGSNLSYQEHLPENYGSGVDAPLIIFNHGSGATGTNNLNDVECCGLPGVIRDRDWDSSLPFVILSPHRQSGLDTNALDQFVEFAIDNYEIDPNKIYMTGWSQGAFITVRYASLYPQKLAAIAPLAGGFFSGSATAICSSNDLPIWIFLGNRDSNLINNVGAELANSYDNCGFSQAAKLTRYSNADHFSTSIWPFLPNGDWEISSGPNPSSETVFDWFLRYSR